MSSEHQLGLDEKVASRALPTKDNERMCPECNRRVTFDPARGIEYGHYKARKSDKETCPLRPPEVDNGSIPDLKD